MTIQTSTRRVKRLPPWLRRSIPLLGECASIERTMRHLCLHTICREGLCPNRAECYAAGRVTFLILGDTCTRSCRFCAVRKGRPAEADPGEPERVALAVRRLGLRHVIVTSVTRDDLPDGGGTLRGRRPRPQGDRSTPERRGTRTGFRGEPGGDRNGHDGCSGCRLPQYGDGPAAVRRDTEGGELRQVASAAARGKDDTQGGGYEVILHAGVGGNDE
jgi:hypothetical protein